MNKTEAKEYLLRRLAEAYCGNCAYKSETWSCYCDFCESNSIKWALSENEAEIIANEILGEGV